MQSCATFSASSAAALAFDRQSALNDSTSYESSPILIESSWFLSDMLNSLSEYSVSASTLIYSRVINSSISFFL